MSAIYIMWMRQLKRYWRSRGRVIGSLGQPILFLVALGFGFSGIYAKAGGGDYMQFLAPGVISMAILFTSMFSGMEVIWDRQFGFLKETLVAPVSRWTIMMGKTLGGATIALIQALIVFIITLLIGFRPVSLFSLLIAFVFMFLIGFMFTAMGVAIACKLEDMQAFPLIMNFLIMPIFFLSGALFPLGGLPKVIEWITIINPLTYGVDGVRGALTGVSSYALTTDFGIIIVFAAIMMSIGTYLFSGVEA